MNERIKQLEKQCWNHRVDGVLVDGHLHFDTQKFAELIIEDACRALNPMLRDMISRGQGVELIKKHFEQQPGWVCPKCGADRTKIACPLGFGAAVDGRCPMIATAQPRID